MKAALVLFLPYRLPWPGRRAGLQCRVPVAEFRFLPCRCAYRLSHLRYDPGWVPDLSLLSLHAMF